MPACRQRAAIVTRRYPVGGDTVSITAGVVSRIEVTSYVHGSMQLLGIQIDAAINSGNSGGPVFDNAGQLVGVAFQSYAGSEVVNVGWVIPTTVIAHFLKDFERHGAYTGFPKLGVQWQRMESDSHKRYLKMKVCAPPRHACTNGACRCSREATLVAHAGAACTGCAAVAAPAQRALVCCARLMSILRGGGRPGSARPAASPPRSGSAR